MPFRVSWQSERRRSGLTEENKAVLQGEREAQRADLYQTARRDLEAKFVTLQRDCESSVDDRILAGVGKARQELIEQFESKIEALTRKSDEAITASETAGRLLAEMIEVIFPRPHKSVAIGRFCQISELPDLAELNAALSASGSTSKLAGIEGETSFSIKVGQKAYATIVRRDSAIHDSSSDLW